MSRAPGRVELVLFAIAFAVRSIPAVRIFDAESGRIHLPGGDPLYHLRRVLFGLEHFPQSLRFDPYINFPFGGEPIWPPFFDTFLALLALPVYDGAAPEAIRSVEILLVWVPPCLGAFGVVALYRVGRRVFDDATAAVAAATLALLPAHYWYSQAGFVDHHAAVALGFVLLLGSAVQLLERIRDRNADGAAAVLGLAFAGMLLLWPGSLLHVVSVEAFLLGAAVLAPGADPAQRLARALTVSNGVAAAVVAPFGLSAEWILWSDFSPVVISRFQPWLLASGSLTGLGLTVAWRHGFGTGRGVRAATALGVGLAVLGIGVSSFPALLEGGADAARWLLKDEAFQAEVAESRPLFQATGPATPPGTVDVTAAEARLTRFLYLLPVVTAWMLWASRRLANGRSARLVAFLVVVFAAATLGQRRFFNSLSVVQALAMGFAAVAAVRGVGRQLEGRARLAALAALGVLGLWMIAPVRHSYGWPSRNVVEWLRGQPPTLPLATARARRLDEAAHWLRENTPETEGFLSQDARPGYGVMALWTHGHRIEMLARRPSVADNFGDDIGEQSFLASHRFFQAPEAEARQLARDLRTRYVFLRTTPPARSRLPESAMQRRLSGDARSVPAWLRLVYDRPMALPGDDSRIRIFEVQGFGTPEEARGGARDD